MLSTENYVAPPNGFRTFVIVWITQAISAFGSQLTFFAITIWLSQTLYPRPEQKPQLAFALTAISLLFGLTVLLAPVAGAWADRHDRKLTMIVMDFGSGIVSLALMLLLFADALQLWMVLLATPVIAILGQFHNFAFDTSTAMIVPEKQLPRANGMMQTLWAVSGILSPAIAATIISLPDLARQGLIPAGVGEALKGIKDGTALAVGIDAVTFFIAAATLIFLFIPSPKRADVGKGATAPKKSMWVDIKYGWRYILKRPPLLWLLATFTVINFASAPLEVFIPLLLKFNLSGDWQPKGFTFSSAMALVSSFAGLGGVIGGVVMSAWGGLKGKRIYGVIVPIMIVGVLEIAYGFSPFIYLTAAINFLIVGAIPIMNSHSQTIWQTQVPRELQGRVFSVRRMIAQFSAPIGVGLAGLTGAAINPGWVLAVLGALTVAFCIAQLFNTRLLRVEDKAYLDSLDPTGLPLNSATSEPPVGDISLGSPTGVPAMPTPSD
ncbi:MAG: MFS transporter [Chloroflexota bacterium]|nr:MFS transporter [Chloroflexota bacterium]